MSDEGDLPVGYADAHHIGSGGWAEVFRCVDPDGHQVALKLFHQRLDDPVTGSEAFRNECEIAARLSAHPGVINLRAAGITAAGRPWLAMDYAPNGTLADLIERSGGTLPMAQAVDICVALADTLEWAHQLVIHGDLKTANVLLDADMRPLLSDFGVATHIGPRHSVTVRQFTQTHAAPEVLKYGRGSIASDVWALTATLYEMLTGDPPFVMRPDEGPGTFIDRVQEGLPEEAIPDWIPEVVGQALRFGLTVDADIRTANMAEAAVFLRTVQTALDMPVTRPVAMPDVPESVSGIPFVGYAEATAPISVPVAVTSPVPPPSPQPPASPQPPPDPQSSASPQSLPIPEFPPIPRPTRAVAPPPAGPGVPVAAAMAMHDAPPQDELQFIRPFGEAPHVPPPAPAAPRVPWLPPRFRRNGVGIAAAVAVLAVILTIAGIALAQTGANGHGTGPSPSPSIVVSSSKPAALPPPPTSAKPTPSPTASPSPSRSPRRSPTHRATHSATPKPSPSSSKPSFGKPTISGFTVTNPSSGTVRIQFAVGYDPAQAPMTCSVFVDSNPLISPFTCDGPIDFNHGSNTGHHTFSVVARDRFETNSDPSFDSLDVN